MTQTQSHIRVENFTKIRKKQSLVLKLKSQEQIYMFLCPC